MDAPQTDRREWLEPDGLGGFASGTVSGIRTRRYHGVLLVATEPPAGRMMLVSGFEAWIEIGNRRFALSSHRYRQDVIHPDGATRLAAFSRDPWPRWRYALEDGASVVHELFVPHAQATAVLTWTLEGSSRPARLVVRPLLSGRDYHALHRENPAFKFEPLIADAAVTWASYPGVPAVRSVSNGTYRHDPHWYRNFEYSEERARGLDDVEDLASPGELVWTLTAGRRAVWVLSPDTEGPASISPDDVEVAEAAMCDTEAARRAAFPSPLDRSADAYIVRRGTGRTIVAGYPWFTDWGRDTFISLRGLSLATGRLADARDILLEWSGTLSGGMLPNRFPDAGGAAEFNAVDASLWFVVATFELERAVARRKGLLSASASARLHDAVDRILQGYSDGTRFRIGCDADGLLAAGESGVQLTWMDAKVGDLVVTSRIGKPVDVNALWLNALRIAGRRSSRWRALYKQAHASFVSRFWNGTAGCLFDVIDVDHEPGAVDASVRPNQIFAVGGLPYLVVDGAVARSIVDTVERHLFTPLGLRTLAPGAPGYAPHYEGDVLARDLAYHQGTVWPWLLGPFVEAWLRVHGNHQRNRAAARRRFVEPLLAHLETAGLGHVSEIADAEFPFTPRGCPFQAWSLGELLRLERVVLAPARAPRARRAGSRASSTAEPRSGGRR